MSGCESLHCQLGDFEVSLISFDLNHVYSLWLVKRNYISRILFASSTCIKKEKVPG